MPSPKTAPEPTPIVTFYSYKGGVGRSMAVLNVAALLASRGFRVLIIDFDLEAPGLSHLVLPKTKKKSAGKPARPSKGGLVELLTDAKERGLKSHLFAAKFPTIAARYTFRYEIPPVLDSHPDARLSIMPAGVQDDDYSARLHRLNLAGLYEEGLGKPLIEHFRQRLITSSLYDYILIDSRTGHSDEAGICTRDLADHRMVVSGLNTQNIEGTAAFLRSLRSALTREGKELKTPDIILSPVPNSEDDLIEKREKAASEAFNSAWGERLPLMNLLIPYHPRLALTEEAYVPTITASPLRNAYLDIEARFRRSLGQTSIDLQSRFLDLLRREDGPGALAALQRWIKLLRKPGKLEATKLPFPPGSLVHQPGNAFKNLLKLEEVLSILELWISNSDSSWGVIELAKQLHKIHAEKAAKLIEFLLSRDLLDADDLGAWAYFLQINDALPQAAEPFFQRAIDADPTNADNLCSYAVFLDLINEDDKSAETLFRRAVEAAPNHARSLGNYAIFLQNVREDYDAAEAFFKRAIAEDPKDAYPLGNYANFLENVREDYDAAEAFYKRAIDADSKHANHLGNYANFLENVREDYDAAEVFYKRAIDADPKHANNLGNYADYLEKVRKDLDAAEAFYKRAIDVDPKNANNLGNYAVFLAKVRKDPDAAETIYKRAIDADPDHANNLGSYAVFLANIRKDPDAAEDVYKRAIEAAAEQANNLANYGQFLLSRGRVAEGLARLRSARENLDRADLTDSAEIAFSLWLGTRLAEAEEPAWERTYKFLIEKSFDRTSWSFDAMLTEAARILKPAELEYAKALAEAFLDESKVAALEEFPRWKKLKPLDPALVNPDGTVREG